VMRSAISLARAFEEDTARKIREVVAETGVPRTFASQILADLVRAGLATSKAGRGGGYRLRRPPAQISVLEVIEAAEGPLRAERCALGEGPCRWEEVCPLHETWSAATVALRDLLATATLAQVAERDAAIEAGTYEVPAGSHRSHAVVIAVADLVQVELGAPETCRAIERVSPDLPALVKAAVGQVSDGKPAPVSPAGVRPPRRRPSAVVEMSLIPAGVAGRSVANSAGRYLLAWQLAGPEPSRLEAELSVVPVDADRSEVRLEGTWRRLAADLPRSRPELDGQAAHRAVRSFLQLLSRSLEQPRQRRDLSRDPAASDSSRRRAGRSV